MSGEVGSLAGDRVVSHERSRPADLSRPHRLCSRNAGSYPSHYCGCLSRCALLAYGHRCRNAVTARNVNSIDASERGQSVAPTTSPSLWMIQPCGRGECPKFGVGPVGDHARSLSSNMITNCVFSVAPSPWSARRPRYGDQRFESPQLRQLLAGGHPSGRDDARGDFCCRFETSTISSPRKLKVVETDLIRFHVPRNGRCRT
jgi:hypothetical protein